MMLSTYIYKVSKNIKFIIYAFCLPILLGQADTAPADESNDNKNQIIAVLDFTPVGIIKLEAEVLTNEFAIELNKTKRVVVYDRIGMKEVASQKGINLEDCNDNKCFSELGKLLNVNQIIIGKIEKLDEFEYINGSPFALNVTMIDIKADSVLSNRDKRFTGDAEVLMNEIQIAAWEVLGAEIPRALLKKRNGDDALNENATVLGTVLRSALVPGLGQIYAGQDVIGYLWMGSGLTIGFLAYSSYDQYKKAYDQSEDYYDKYMNAKDPQSVREFRNLGIQAGLKEETAAEEAKFMINLGLGVYAANLIHAYLTAPKSKSVSASNQKPLFDFVYNQKLKQPQLRFSIALD
jgi:TM2 domain-containing membrane protein YozV